MEYNDYNVSQSIKEKNLFNKWDNKKFEELGSSSDSEITSTCSDFSEFDDVNSMDSNDDDFN